MVYLRTQKTDRMINPMMQVPALQIAPIATPRTTMRFPVLQKGIIAPTSINAGTPPKLRSFMDQILAKQAAAIASRHRRPLPAPPPNKIQNTINRILGATPEQPIRIPIQFGQVEVKADKSTQNLLLGLGGITLVGVLLYANR